MKAGIYILQNIVVEEKGGGITAGEKIKNEY